MVVKEDEYIDRVKSFLNLLLEDGFDVSEAYIFGSAIKGSEDEDSDIDVALVSKDFEGLPYYDVKKIFKYRKNVDLRIEVHPFALNDVKSNPSPFYLNIKKSGIKIH